MGDWVVPPVPYNSIPQRKASLTTKLLPNHLYFSPWPAVSYANPVLTGVASQHVPKTKWPGNVQTCPRRPDSSSYIQSPRYSQTTYRHLQITCSSTGTPGMLGTEKRKLQRFWCLPGHPVHRAGAAIMAHTYPWICGTCMLPHHPKAPPETPCKTSFVRIRRLEWMVHIKGWRSLVKPDIPVQLQRKPTGINRFNWMEHNFLKCEPTLISH